MMEHVFGFIASSKFLSDGFRYRMMDSVEALNHQNRIDSDVT